jgi:hypothetical protein
MCNIISRSDMLHRQDQLSLHIVNVLMLCAYRGALSSRLVDASAGVPGSPRQIEDRVSAKG